MRLFLLSLLVAVVVHAVYYVRVLLSEFAFEFYSATRDSHVWLLTNAVPLARLVGLINDARKVSLAYGQLPMIP